MLRTSLQREVLKSSTPKNLELWERPLGPAAFDDGGRVANDNIVIRYKRERPETVRGCFKERGFPADVSREEDLRMQSAEEVRF
jgi:hypothetical protein